MSTWDLVEEKVNGKAKIILEPEDLDMIHEALLTMAHVDEDNMKFISANAWRKVLTKVELMKKEI